MRENWRVWAILAGTGVVVTVVLLVMLMNLRSPQTLRYRMDLADRGPELRTVTIYYLEPDSPALAPLQREVLGGRTPRELAGDLVAYLSQSSQGYRAPLPPGTTLLHYFEDGEGQLTLNFNARIGAVRGSGITEERLRLSALVRTLAENIGATKQIRLLMLGRPLERWGAHLVPGSDLEVSAW